MKFITRKTHAVLDYLMGVLLIASPWLFGFADVEAAKWSAIAVGAVMLLTSLMTDYEGGVMKSVSMGTHLTLDLIAGLFLAASPWLLGFNDMVYLPHLILGIMEIGAALCTQRTSQHAFGHGDVRHA